MMVVVVVVVVKGTWVWERLGLDGEAVGSG